MEIKLNEIAKVIWWDAAGHKKDEISPNFFKSDKEEFLTLTTTYGEIIKIDDGVVCIKYHENTYGAIEFIAVPIENIHEVVHYEEKNRIKKHLPKKKKSPRNWTQ